MRKQILIFVALLFFASSVPVLAGEYTENLKNDYARGFQNMVTAPAEIPMTISKYHKEEKTPIVREARGLVDGVTRGIDRLFSGAWDWVAGLIPSDQDGEPVDPERIL